MLKSDDDQVLVEVVAPTEDSESQSSIEELQSNSLTGNKNRRQKRQKNHTSATNPSISNDEIGRIFYNHSQRRKATNGPIMFLLRASLACLATLAIQQFIHSCTSTNLFISQVDAFDQEIIISTSNSVNDDLQDKDKKGHSTLRSVVDKVLHGGELQSFVQNLDQYLTGSSKQSSSSSQSISGTSSHSRKHLNQQHHISSKRGDLYDLALRHPVYETLIEHERTAQSNDKSDLKGICASYKDKDGYWTYEWCHGAAIVQYHEPMKYVIGTYEGETSAGVEIYSGGDVCTSMNHAKKRSASIVYQCCSDNTLSNKNSIVANAGVFIRLITENHLCEYTLHVCRAADCLSPNDRKKNSTQNENQHSQGTHENLFPPMPLERVEQNKKLIKKMFTHAYDSYMYNAHPAGELRPLSCRAGAFDLVKLKCLTLIDTLDSLLIFGNYTEFARSVERLRYEDTKTRTLSRKNHRNRKKDAGGLFDSDQNVSVFETNIRILGGLLSAHQLAVAALKENKDIQIPLNHILDSKGSVLIGSLDVQTESSIESKLWEYDGFLLKLAEDMGERLLPSFESKSGIPFGTVNLRKGVPTGETPIASLAGGGTLTLEMELLSRLTGNPDYGNAAKLATRALWVRRSPLTSLLGKHIDINSGKWKETLSGIGSNSDSFYEYLLKHYILFGDEDFWLMFVDSYKGIMKHVKTGDWYSDVDMTFPQSKKNVMESLQAFWPGVQILLGELVPAAKTLNSYFLVREELGFLPERFHFEEWKVDGSGRGGAGKYPLRPELLESAYMMHRALHSSSPSSGWQWAMDFSLATLQRLTWTECGYASVKSVRRGGRKRDIELDDDMPSFFLSETLKYLYLIFDNDNFIHQDDGREWVFTTEAHPIHHVSEALIKERLREEEEFLSILSTKKNRKKVPKLLHRQGPQQWASSTKEADFLSQIQSVERQYSHNFNISLMDLFYGPITFSNVTRAEEVRSMDLPELHFYPHGRESSLPKSCVNHFHSSLDWMHALNGNAGLEYEEVYDSILTNDYQKEESLSPYRPHHKKVKGEDVCEIREGVEINQQQAQATEPSTKQMQVQNIGGNRFDTGSMGSFDVTAFEEGFFVRHSDTNEAIEVTAVQSEASEPPSMFMVRASVGNEDRMIVADDKNNAFLCEFIVKFVQKGIGKEFVHEMARIPCSPAMFGPTKLSELVANGGVVAEGSLIIPITEDFTGCKSGILPPDNLQVVEDRIQIVMRGECAFHEKAIKQKLNQNAKGVIVVNTQPGQLFVMDTSDTTEKVEEEPATILITNEHGRELIKRLQKQILQRSRETNDFIGSIQLNRIPPTTSIQDQPSKWPHVASSSDNMQILSKSKWGVHGTKAMDSNGKMTWQIRMLQHNYDLNDAPN